MSRRVRAWRPRGAASPWPTRLGLAAMVVASALVRLRIAGCRSSATRASTRTWAS